MAVRACGAGRSRMVCGPRETRRSYWYEVLCVRATCSGIGDSGQGGETSMLHCTREQGNRNCRMAVTAAVCNVNKTGGQSGPGQPQCAPAQGHAWSQVVSLSSWPGVSLRDAHLSETAMKSHEIKCLLDGCEHFLIVMARLVRAICRGTCGYRWP